MIYFSQNREPSTIPELLTGHELSETQQPKGVASRTGFEVGAERGGG